MASNPSVFSTMDHYLYCFSCHIPLVGLTSLFRVTALNVNTSCLGKNPEVEVLCTFKFHSVLLALYLNSIHHLYLTVCDLSVSCSDEAFSDNFLFEEILQLPRAQTKTWYLNACCKYSDVSLYLLAKNYF